MREDALGGRTGGRWLYFCLGTLVELLAYIADNDGCRPEFQLLQWGL